MYKVNDVITIDNNEDYVIVNRINYNDNDYYYIVLVDIANKMLKDVCKIIKITDNHIELVEDGLELESIIPIFKKQYA